VSTRISLFYSHICDGGLQRLEEGFGTFDVWHVAAVVDRIQEPAEPLASVLGDPEGAPGRARKRSAHLLADRGYSFEGCRRLLRSRGIPHTIPERKDQRERRATRPERKPGFKREAYRRGNVVERCVNRLKHYRGIEPPAMRSERSTTGLWWSSPR
jgi:transposase